MSFICLPLVFHSGSGWSHDFPHLSPICLSFVSHLSPTLGLVVRMISFTFPPICLSFVSHSGSGWSHDFLHLSPICLSFVSHLAPTLGRVGRMISFTCLPLVFHLFPLVSHSESGWSHDFLHLSPICLSFVSRLSSTLGLVGRMISFTVLPFVFHSPNRFTCMVFLLLSKGCIPGPHDFASVSGLASHSGCLSLHCLPLVSHSGFFVPHEFTLVSPLSPTLWVPWAA